MHNAKIVVFYFIFFRLSKKERECFRKGTIPFKSMTFVNVKIIINITHIMLYYREEKGLNNQQLKTKTFNKSNKFSW